MATEETTTRNPLSVAQIGLDASTSDRSIKFYEGLTRRMARHMAVLAEAVDHMAEAEKALRDAKEAERA